MAQNNSLSTELSQNIDLLHRLLPLGKSFDLITRDLRLGETPAFWLGINGFCNTEILQQIFSDLQDPHYTLDSEIRDLPLYVQSRLGYAQVSLTSSVDDILQNLLSGPSILLVDGFDQAVIIDVRTYPVRSISEPDTERSTRGARDGFVETLLFNTNLIRRRVRSAKLTFSICTLGTESRTDVAIAYLADQVNEELLETLKQKLSQLQITSLTMGSKSLEELLIHKRWWNPLPSIQLTERPDVACSYLCEGHILLIVDNSPAVLLLPGTIFQLQITSLTMGSKSLEELLIHKRWWNPLPSIQLTERPDVACSYLCEGHILLIVDNSPAVLLLPGTIFQFTQSPEDYYNNPLTGTYFRMIRFLCIPVSLLLLPVFLLLSAYYPEITASLQLTPVSDLSPFRLFFYVLAVEFLLDLFKYSAALSSSRVSGALSIVGGLLIGDIAVSLNWASTEVLFYAAVTMLANLSLSSIEFADALRIYRILLVVTTGLWGLPGFIIGLTLVSLSMITTPTFAGFSYFWPLFPFNGPALRSLLFRRPTYKAQPSKVWFRGHVHTK